MREALSEAELAAAAGDVPVGAVIVKDGEIVEMGDTDEVFRSPKHIYTKQLISSRI